MKRSLSLLLALVLAFSLVLPACAAEGEESLVLTQALDYDDPENWACLALGEDREADVFLLCPTVDTRSELNAFDLNDKLKGRFLSALEIQKGIYGDAGRPIILAGFSQGAEMCLELLKTCFGGDTPEARSLRERLVAVYAIGWSVTEEMTETWPQIVPAAGETDTGVVVSYDCENGELTETPVIPAGVKALSINPLNWKTDGTPADRSLNLGAVTATDAEPVPGLCGAYIGDRGELVVTEIDGEDYPPNLPILPQGAYHVYDCMFFFTNLKRNVADRLAAWQSAQTTPPEAGRFRDVDRDAWYAGAVDYVTDLGLMQGTAQGLFSPDTVLTRAQTVTILWRLNGQPAPAASAGFQDVEAGTWYCDAVNWAAGEGIVQGIGSGRFGTGDPVTREQLAVLFWRMNGAPDGNGDLSAYPDGGAVSAWAGDALSWAVDAGVLRGRGSGLDPQGTATRAEAAQIMMNIGTRTGQDR